MHSIKGIYNRIPYQIKASVVILIASFATSAISFLTTPIFTRLMSVEEYGLVVQYNSVLEVITVIATLSLSAGVYPVAMNEFRSDRSAFTFSAMILSNISTTVVFSLIFVFHNAFESFFKLNLNMFICMFVFLMIYPAMQMWMARQRYEYNYKSVAIVSIVTTILSLGSGVIAVSMVKDVNLGGVKIWVTSIAQVMCALVIYISIAQKSSWKPQFKFIKYAFMFNAPLLVHYLAQYVLRSSDKIMITNICGERATGLYGLGTTVASIAIMAWGAMAASLTPYTYSHISSKEYDKVNRANIAVIGIFGICCVAVALIGPEVVYILGSSKYIENIGLIPPISASSLLAAIYGIYSSIAFLKHKRASTAIMTIIAALINIGLNYWLIPIYGYIAAAYTTEIAYLIYTFLHYLNYRRIVGEERIYKDKYIWGITAVTTVLCLLAGLFYDSWQIRYGLIACIIIIAFIVRKQMLSLIRTILGR